MYGGVGWPVAGVSLWSQPGDLGPQQVCGYQTAKGQAGVGERALKWPFWGSTRKNCALWTFRRRGIRCFGRQVEEDVCRRRRPSEVAKGKTSAKDYCGGIHWQVGSSRGCRVKYAATPKEGNERLFSSYGGAYCSNREPEVFKHGGKNASVTTGQELPFVARKKNIGDPRLPGTSPTRLKLKQKQTKKWCQRNPHATEV